MSKIDQIHLRAVMLCMSKMSKIGKEHTLSCIKLLTFQFAWVIKLWCWHLQIQFIHIFPTHSFEDEKESFEDGRQSFENEKQTFMTS